MLRRIRLWILAIGIAGSIAALIWKGRAVAGGFLIGSAVSFVSFWRWQKVVEGLQGGQRRGSPVPFMLRALLFAGAGYVIIRFLGLNLAASLVGLLVSTAAVILEIVYELIYAGT